MKNLVILFIGLIVGVFVYQKFENDNSANVETTQCKETVSVMGTVTANFTIVGQSVYRLEDSSLSKRSYIVLVKGEAPKIGESLNVMLSMHEMVVLNDYQVAIYSEESTDGAQSNM